MECRNASADPTKKVIHCLACDKVTQGHFRSVKNVALKINHTELLSVLNIDLSKNTDDLSFCDACIRTVEKIIKMRIVCRINLCIAESQKQINLHSTSPNIGKQHIFQTSRSSNTKESGRSQRNHPPKEPSVNSGESHKDEGDHSYAGSNSTKEQSVTSGESHKDKGDHCYAGINSETNVSDIFAQHKLRFFEASVIDEHVQQTLLEEVSFCSNVERLITTLMKDSYANETLWKMFLLNLNSELDLVCGTKFPSVLRTKQTDLDAGVFLDEIVKEIHTRCPRVLDVLIVLTCPLTSAVPKGSHAISAMYAMATYSRNPHLIAFQRLITASCLKYNAGKGLLGILNKCGISVPEKSKYPVIGLSEGNNKRVSDSLQDGRPQMRTVDNVEIKTYQVKMNYMDVIGALSKKNGMCVICGQRSIKDLSKKSRPHPGRQKYLTDLLWKYGNIRTDNGYLCLDDEKRLISLEKKHRLFQESCQKTKNVFKTMACLDPQIIKHQYPSNDRRVKDSTGIAQHNSTAVTSADKIHEINLKDDEFIIVRNESETSDDNDAEGIEYDPEDNSDIMKVNAEHKSKVTKEVEKTGQYGTERLRGNGNVIKNNTAVFDETEIGMNEITISLHQSKGDCTESKKMQVSGSKITKSKTHAEGSQIEKRCVHGNDKPRTNTEKKDKKEEVSKVMFLDMNVLEICKRLPTLLPRPSNDNKTPGDKPSEELKDNSNNPINSHSEIVTNIPDENASSSPSEQVESDPIKRKLASDHYREHSYVHVRGKKPKVKR